jgi:hypothetical protein
VVLGGSRGHPLIGAPTDPVASAAYGVTKAVLEGAVRFLQRIANRELSGSDDPSVIETIKAQRRVPEFDVLKKFIPDKELRIQAQLGLALRKFQGPRANASGLESLRQHLQQRFGTPGLHVAELVARGLVTAYVNLLVSEQETDADIITRLDSFLRNVDRYALFVLARTSVEQTLEKVRLRLATEGPGTVAIFAKRQARTNLGKIVKALRRDPEDYIIRTVSTGDEEMVFVSLLQAWMDADDIEPPRGLLTAQTRRIGR